MGVSQTFRVERSDDRKNVCARRLPQLRMAPITAVPHQSLLPREIDHHNGDYVPHSFQTVCGFFNVAQNLLVQGL